jgi:hypothetical protein
MNIWVYNEKCTPKSRSLTEILWIHGLSSLLYKESDGWNFGKWTPPHGKLVDFKIIIKYIYFVHTDLRTDTFAFC